MKRLLTLILAFTMAVSVLGTTPIYAESSELIVHYHRDDGGYEDWNLWVWVEGGEGEAYPFQYTDDYGVVAVIELPEEAERVGFIVRTDNWDKDISTDRFVDLVSGFAEIWVMSGEEEFSINPPDNFLPFDASDFTLIGEQESAEVEDVGPAEDVHVRIHYHRYDGEYDGWNLWMWGEGADGSAYEFNKEDDFGMLADVIIPAASNSSTIGIIVRLNDFQAKDVEEDRYMRLSEIGEDGILDLYLVQSDASLYYDLEDVDLSPKFIRAELNTMNSVDIEVSIPFNIRESEGLFSMTSNDGSVIEVTSVDSDEEGWINQATLQLAEGLVLGSTYTLTSETYGDIGIAMTKAFDLQEFEDVFYYDGDDLGAVYTVDATTFKLWSPLATSVSLNLYSEGLGDNLIGSYPMEKSDKGTWVYTISGDQNGVFYTYSVSHDTSLGEGVDPYAKAVGVNGDRGMVVDLSTTNPDGWEDDTNPTLESYTDAIVYELHIRDLSTSADSGIENTGKYLGLTETGTVNKEGLSTGLDHILELGVTHVQLLPVFDYRTIDETSLDTPDFNWGYDPENYNAPEGSYSTDPYDGALRINEFKTMVQTLHDNDLGVIMDVVYNHTGATADSHLNQLVPNYYYRTIGDTFSNGSGCGNETASERAMVRKMIVDSVVYWATEYHVDGFRFDLMGLHDQETMQAVKDALTAVNPNIIVYGEGWTGGTSPLPDEEKCLKVNTLNLDGIGAFSDDIRDGIKGHVFEATTPGFVNGATDMEASVQFGIVAATEHPQINYSAVNYSDAPWANSPEQSINYAEAHDNLTLWDKLMITNPNATFDEMVAMDHLAASIFLTSQGVPFIHAGMEFLRTKDGDENSYKSSDEVNQLNWTMKTENIDTFNYYAGLIDLRQAHPAFRMRTTEEISDNLTFYGIGSDFGELQLPAEEMIGYAITNHANGDEAGTILVFFNANEDSYDIQLPQGNWDVVVNKEIAGTETIETVSQKVEIAGISALILTSSDVIDTKSMLHTAAAEDTKTSTESDSSASSSNTEMDDSSNEPKDDSTNPMGWIIGIIAFIGAGIAGFLTLKKRK